MVLPIARRALPASASAALPQARTELLALIGQLYTSLRSRFNAQDTAQVFLWVEKFCRNPWSGACGGLFGWRSASGPIARRPIGHLA
jgi:hypothetical protein